MVRLAGGLRMCFREGVLEFDQRLLCCVLPGVVACSDWRAKSTLAACRPVSAIIVRLRLFLVFRRLPCPQILRNRSTIS
jgi:hypothetical protein